MSGGGPQVSTVVEDVVIEETAEPQESETLVLHLKPPEYDGPHVTWAPNVIDNEHLGRLKSNCCCIYVKPRQWDDPSTWEQDEHETEHCRGHTLPSPRKNPDEKDGHGHGHENHGCSDGCC